MNGTNCNTDERGLLPYPVILAATKGDPEAMNIVMQHYQSYIAHLSIRKIRDERGNTYYGVDEDLRERLQSKLMRAVLSFKADMSLGISTNLEAVTAQYVNVRLERKKAVLETYHKALHPQKPTPDKGSEPKKAKKKSSEIEL